MDRRKHGELALQILKSYGGGVVASGEEPAKELISRARELLIERAKELANQIHDLGFKYKQIAKEIRISPQNLSRICWSHDTQFSLPKLRTVVDSLPKAFLHLGAELIAQGIDDAARLLCVLECCPEKETGPTETVRVEGQKAFVHNLALALQGKPLEERKSYPKGIHGILLRIGEPGWRLYGIGLNPGDDLPTLVHEVRDLYVKLKHELDRRKKAEKGRRHRRRTGAGTKYSLC